MQKRYNVTLVNDHEIKVITTEANNIDEANYLAYESFCDSYDQITVEEQ